MSPRQPDYLEFHGEKGTIILENYQIAQWDVLDSEPGEPTAEELAFPGTGQGTNVGHFLQIQDMVQAVREDRDPVITGTDALHSLAVVQAIYSAAYTHRRVKVPSTT